MALAAGTHWAVQTGGSDGTTGNGGGFDTGNANFPTDMTTDTGTGNTAAPVVSSASYNFIARDVGHWVFVKSGTNWNLGWFKIASVASNKATLNATIGAWVNFTTMRPGTVTGCATVGTPTSGTWGVDYSQTNAAGITFTDMVIGNPTTTTFTSAAFPVGKHMVGNIIAVSSGTNFTVQRVQITSTSGTTATVDKTLGTAGATGGNGKLGGALATPTAANALIISTNFLHVAAGTYTLTSPLAITVITVELIGYGIVRGDGGTKPLITTSTNSTNLVTTNGNAGIQTFRNLSLSNTAGTRAYGLSQSTQHGTTQRWEIVDCLFDGFTIGINSDNIVQWDVSDIFVSGTEVKNCSSHGVASFVGFIAITNSWFHNNGGDGVNTGAGVPRVEAKYSISSANSGSGWNFSQGPVEMHHCIGASNTLKGVWGSVSATVFIVRNSIFYGNTASQDMFFNNNWDPARTRNLGLSYNNAYGATSSWGISPGDVTLTSDPFTSSTNFSLNATAGGGAAIKAVGYPSTYPGLSGTSYPDIGAYQHQDSASGGSHASVAVLGQQGVLVY